MRRVALFGLILGFVVLVGCDSQNGDPDIRTLVFEPETGDFSFSDSSGNRVIYERTENTLIVEPDIDVEQLALAFCRAEQETSEPAGFAAVSLVLAEALVPFIETVERVCER